MISKAIKPLKFVVVFGLILAGVVHTQPAKASHICICIFDNPHFSGFQFPNETEKVCDEESCEKLCQNEVRMPHPWELKKAECTLDDSLKKSKPQSSV